MEVDSSDGSETNSSMPRLIERMESDDDSSTDEENEVQYDSDGNLVWEYENEYYDTDETEATSVLTDEDEMYDKTFENFEDELVDLTLYDPDEEIVDLTENLEEENNEVILMAID